MKIAILGMSSNIGGVETFIMNIYRVLKKDNHKFYFFSVEEHICFEEEILKNNDVILNYCSRKENLKKHKNELKKIFSEYKFDVYWHNCCSLSNIEEIKQAYKANVPTRIIHSHNSKNMGSTLTLVLHLIHKYTISKYITHVFACSQIAANWMFTNKLNKKMIIFHNAIDAKKFIFNPKTQKEVRNKYSINQNTLVIGHVGRFHFQKNHKYLINIFNELYKKDKNILLVLCGEGELKEEILLLVKQLNLENNVMFLGNQKEMYKIYQMFDIFCFPSLFEGLPFVLVEAQAAGIPCVVSNNISKEIKLTDMLFFEDINSNPCQWVDTIEKVRLIKKKNTFDELSNCGYDIENNREEFYCAINEKEKF